MYAGQPAELSYFLTYEILPVVGVTAAVCMAIKYVGLAECTLHGLSCAELGGRGHADRLPCALNP